MSNAGIAVESAQVVSQLPSDAKSHRDVDALPDDEVPAWLTKSFIEKNLRNHFDDKSLKVKKMKVSQCGGKGESYASVMFRIAVSYTKKGEEKTISLVVKTLPENEMAKDKLGSGNYNVQNKEMEMYERLLPKFKRILQSINEDAEIFPEVIGVDKSLEVIIMVDLMEKKFVMADRLKGLDLNHTLISLRKLARMHAASMVVHQKNPQSFEGFDTGFFTRKTDCFHVMFESLCECLIEEIPSWDGFEHFAEKLKIVRRDLVKNARKAFDCDEGELQVLTHGEGDGRILLN
jgi:hypothetical protein